ncbi:DUF692 domain-containing protein [Roseateles sp. So40a]|uniref:DUF692 domain-containing protein n=1 Tax=Roseateles sp. So40a TaxID=3400226 RepID=UPI003A8B8606
MTARSSLWPVAVGIAWEPTLQAALQEALHASAMARAGDGFDFIEVHTENFLAPDSHARALLVEAAQRMPVSLHGVGLGLGSAAGIDWQHLRRVRALVEAVRPGLVSDHAGFCRVLRHQQPMHAHAQLPIPFTALGLDVLAAQVDAAQQTLGRQILVENLGAYLCWDEDDLPEPEFLNTLAARTGCGLLVDLNHLVVNALNRGQDEDAAIAASVAWLERIDAAAVGQYHLAGHARLDGIVIDDHGGPVGEPVWALYREALGRIGARPTLIEWDQTLPGVAALTAEVARARDTQSAFAREQIAPPPARPGRDPGRDPGRQPGRQSRRVRRSPSSASGDSVEVGHADE